MVREMKVGQKVQAIVPPELAFGEKGELKDFICTYFISAVVNCRT